MAIDWFRTPDWDDAARADFEARLRRSREHNRPQYLAIKAMALRDAGLLDPARELLERVVIDPDSSARLDLPKAHELLGDIAARQDDWPEAEAHYRKVLGYSPDLHSTTGTVHISLANVLSHDSNSARHVEALALLDAYLRRRSIQWHSAVFRWHLVRIRLAIREDDLPTTLASARAALELANQPSAFPRHGDVGTVHASEEILDDLRRLAIGKSARRRLRRRHEARYASMFSLTD